MQAITLKLHKIWKKVKSKDSMSKTYIILAPCPIALRQC
jgi:hypothetical protein